MSTNTSRWWGDATADEASGCENVVDTFLNDPNPANGDSFARALALFILLGGDDTNILKEIRGVEDSHLNDVWIGLKLSHAARSRGRQSFQFGDEAAVGVECLIGIQ